MNRAPTVSPAALVLLVKGDSGTRAYIIMYGAIASTTLLSALRICSSSVLRDCHAAVGSASACTGYKLELVLTEGLPNDLALVMCRIIREFFLDLLEGV